ncbi:uncharacterized protein LOC134537731 [Bacillus rossius redtenbacheri]|uniref:uncharacterized protein LOC134537731 n=1 Tax=Bacillus rossius redtenbacheri TaxID=93214 RepID=UPI002FDCA517
MEHLMPYKNRMEHTTRRNISHSMKSRKLAMELFESCKMLDQFLKPLPEEKLMTMKLIYYNEVTPRDYEPLGFEASRNSAITYACEGIPQKYRVGSVVTKFHKTKLHLQSTLIDKKVVKEYKKNKQQQQVTGTSKESPNVVNSTTESCASTSTVTDICITVQLTPEQPLQEPITESSSHADMLQFNVPKPRRRRAKSCSNCETHALANLKKRKTVSDGALKDKKMKRNTSIQVRKIVKKAKARKMCANTDSEDKIGNSAVPRVVRSNKKTAEVKNETGMNDSDATTTDMEIGETFTADTDEESGSSNSEFQKEQVSLSKSSVATETIRIRDDSPDPSEVFIKKEVNCCCWKMTEHEPMILCQHCKMWQHRICYGIMDGCGGGDFDEQMHYCVECASIDQSKPCTDKTLLGMNSEARMTMTLFRRAFELLQHHATITATLMQMKLMLSKKLIRQLVAQLMGKDILVAANPESTTFAVNQEQYGVWLGRLKRKA